MRGIVIGAALLLAAPFLISCGGTSELEREQTSPPLCNLPGAEETFERFDALPAPVASDLLSRFADVPTVDSAASLDHAIAPRGAFYNETYSRSTLLPNRRFIEAAKRGDDILVMYEHGGGPHVHAVVYRRGETGGYYAFANVVSDMRVRCETAARALANPKDPVLYTHRIDW